MAKVKLTDDMPTALKEIILETRRNGEWHVFELQPYCIETLERCLMYLEDKGMYVTLQREIKRELKMRKAQQNYIPPAGNGWFPQYWMAVLSLFGKGDMDRNNPATKAILANIDPAWVNNCKGAAL